MKKLCLLATVVMLVLAAASTSIAAGVVTVRYAQWANVEEHQATVKIIAAFEKAHPNIRVKLEYAPWDQYWQKLQAQLASGTAPDVFQTNGGYFLQFASKNTIMDLSPLLEKDRTIDLNDYFFLKGVFVHDGKVKALPRDLTTVALYFNKTLFKQAGLSFPNESWDWNTLLEFSRKLTMDMNSDKKPEQFGFFFPNGLEGYGPFFWAGGGGVLNPQKTKSIVDSENTIHAIGFLADLINKHKVSPSPAVAQSMGDPFLTGRVGMIAQRSGYEPAYSKAPFEWGIAPLPYGISVDGRKKRATTYNALGNVIYARSKQVEAAWTLLKFLSGETAQRILAETRIMIPALKKVAFSSLFLDPKTPPGMDRKVFLDAYEYGYDLQYTLTAPQWRKALDDEMQLAWMGEKSPAEAAKDASKKINTILATENQ